VDSVSDLCGETGSVSVTFTATDDCGNASTTSATFTIVDTLDPVITCPSDVTVECDQSFDPSELGFASSEDECSSGVDVFFSDSVFDGRCDPDLLIITRTWTAKDDCGRMTTCDQVITVEDVTAPSITCPSDATVECDESTDVSELGMAFADDNCDTDVAISFTDNTADGFCDPNVAVITRTWSAIDNCYNTAACDQRITVVDITAPTISCPADATVECDESTDVSELGVASATDNCDTDVAVSFTDSTADGFCDPNLVVITRTWSAIDNCYNTDTCDQRITVVDTTPPVISCPSDVTVGCDESTEASELGSASAEDTCDANVLVSFTDSTAGILCDSEAIITRTWTALDKCGNTAVCDQVITAEDTT